MCLGRGREAKAEIGVGKFGKKGMVHENVFRSMGIDKKEARELSNISNHGLSKSTWSNYSTAERMLKMCGKATGKCMELPLDQAKTLIFINWLVKERQAKHGTICSYLAGIKQLHVILGLEKVVIRTELVNLVLNGRRNQEILEKKRGDQSRGRLPVTLAVMKLIKGTLRDSHMETKRKLSIWAICCLAFNGSFRIHELLCKEEEKFDPQFTLLNKDIKVVRDMEKGKEVIVLFLKWPKEDKAGKGIEMEVFETDNEVCPVRALKKWWQWAGSRNPDQPAFMQPEGGAWTGKLFNKELHDLLKPHVDAKEGSITSHSFRSGVPSMLGRVGYSDAQLQAVGRWSSRAFEHYVKLPRSKRREMAVEISKL